MKLIISEKTFYLINEIHSRNPNYLLHLFLESYLNNKNMCDDEINDFHINSIGIVKPNYIKN